MTEQQPSAEQIAREVWQKIQVNLTTYTTSYRLFDLMIPIEIAIKEERRLCEQRVSAETERCARIAHRHRPAVAGWALDATETIEREIRAPAERPAPPQQPDEAFCEHYAVRELCPVCAMGGDESSLPQDGCSGTGVEQPTQETDRPGCGDHRLPCDVWVRHIKYGNGVRLQTLADAAARWLAAAQQAERSVPSAFASTGDVPYTVAEAVLRAWDKDEADLSHSADMHDAIEALRNVAAPSAVASTGEQPASPAAVVDYTERAREVLADAAKAACYGMDEEDAHIAIFEPFLETGIAAALSVVASEHQAALEAAQYEVQRWKDVAAKKYSIDDLAQHREEGRQEALAGLREPDVREDAAEAGIEAASEAVSALPMGQRAWSSKGYNIAETSARAAIAWIVEVLSDFFVVGFMVGLGIGWLLWMHGVSISSIRALF